MKLTLTIGSQSREVEVEAAPNGDTDTVYTVEAVALAKTNKAATKSHSVKVRFVRKNAASPFVAQLRTVVLNRQATIIGFAK